MTNLEKEFDKKFICKKHPFDSSHVFAEEVQGKLPEEFKKFIRQREKELLKEVDGIVDDWPTVVDRIDLRRTIKELNEKD